MLNSNSHQGSSINTITSSGRREVPISFQSASSMATVNIDKNAALSSSSQNEISGRNSSTTPLSLTAGVVAPAPGSPQSPTWGAEGVEGGVDVSGWHQPTRDDDHEVPKCLRKGRRCCCLVVFVIFVWTCLILPPGIIFSIKFFHKLSFADFKAGEGTILQDTQYDDREYAAYGQRYTYPEYLLIKAKPPGTSLLGPLRYTVFDVLSNVLKGYVEQQGIPNVRSYWLPGYNNTNLIGGTNNDTAVFIIDWQYGGAKEFVSGFNDALNNKDVKFLLNSSFYDIQLGGMAQLEDALHHTVLKNMGITDAVCISIGLTLFAIAVKAPFAFPIPLIILIFTVAPTLGLADLVKSHMHVTGFAPEIMASITIALSIDFSLFMMSRVRECMNDEAFSRYTPAAIVWHSYRHVGHNIGVSGIAIALAFGGLAFINSDFVRSIAIVCCIGALVVLICCVTLLPCLVWIAHPQCTTCCGAVKPPYLKEQEAEEETKQSEQQPRKEDPSAPLLVGSSRSEDTENTPSAVNNNRLTNDSLIGVSAFPIPTPLSKRSITSATAGGDTSLLSEEEEILKKQQQSNAFETAMKSPWAKVAQKCQKYWFITIPVVLALCAPFLIIVGTDFKYDGNFFSVGPHDVDAYWNILEVQDTFGNQADSPVWLYLKSNVENPHNPDPQDYGMQDVGSKLPLLSREIWPVYDIIYRSLKQLPAENTILSEGLGFSNLPHIWKGKRMDWETANRTMWYALPGNKPAVLKNLPKNWTKYLNITEDLEIIAAIKEVQKATEYVEYLKTFTGPCQYWNGNITAQHNGMISFGMRHPTWGARGFRYLDDLQEANTVIRANIAEKVKHAHPRSDIVKYLREESLFVGFNGPNSDMWYVMKKVMPQFKTEVMITVGMLFAAMLLLFRSFAISVISIFTMGLTVATSFGIVVCCVHYSWLHSVWPELKHVHNYFWVIVILAFSICCVLSLDYNVYMIVRTLEFRSHGRNNKDAVIAAVGATGPVISFAALIMMVAFGGLVAANTMMLNQFGLTLSLAVLLDAFIVRPILVPALVVLFPGRALWFPRCGLPEEEPSLSEEREENRKTFLMYDQDGDGMISPADLKKTIRQTIGMNVGGKELTDKQLDRLVARAFRRADLDGDGFISFEEFELTIGAQGQHIV